MHSTTYDRKSRIMVQGAGVQGMSKVAVCIANPFLDDWDSSAAPWTVLVQMAAKVQVQLQHPAAQFANIKAFTTKKTEILSSSSPDPAYAKMICLKVLKGGALPEQFASQRVSQRRTEGGQALARDLTGPHVPHRTNRSLPHGISACTLMRSGQIPSATTHLGA